MAYPEGGYWAVAPGARLRMLRALCCDALDTAIIRCALALALDLIPWKPQRYPGSVTGQDGGTPAGNEG